MLRNSRIPLFVTLAGALGLALVPQTASAQLPLATGEDAACMLHGTSLANSFVNSPEGGDNDFFTQSGGPPNIVFLMDTSGSMGEMVVFPDATGCDFAPYDNLRAQKDPTKPPEDSPFLPYDSSFTYPDFDPGFDKTISGTNVKDGGFKGLYEKDKYYACNAQDDCSEKDESDVTKVCPDKPPAPIDPDGDGEWWDDFTRYEIAAYIDPGYDRDKCRSCLATKGWYRYGLRDATDIADDDDDRHVGWPSDPDGDDVPNAADENFKIFVANGNWMNIFPPKYVVARKALKTVLSEVQPIRMSVAGFHDDKGAFWLDRPNPSCSSSWPVKSNFYSNRNAIISNINGLKRNDFDGVTPLAEALLNVGQYFTENNQAYVADFGSTSSHIVSGGGGSRDFKSSDNPSANEYSICWPCQNTSVVIITDGLPCRDNDVPAAISGKALPCPGCSNDTCNSSTGPFAAPTLHKVSHYLQNRDLRKDHEGMQRVTTYTVAFGLNRPDADALLSQTAENGGGYYVKANRARELAQAIKDIIDDVIQRSASFTTSNLAGIQTQSNQSVLVPRFVPQRREPWQGQLYRFDFYSEFAAQEDRDNDGSMSKFFLVDADGDPIRASDIDGLFYKLENGTVPTGCDSGWCDDAELSNTLAVPHWEAGEEMKAAGSDARNIWTIVDSNGDGDIDAQDTEIPFTVASAPLLLPYLGLEVTGACENAAELLGLSYSPSLLECAETLIAFVRGKKLDLTDDRKWLLSDIFHSAPVIVEPPTPKSLIWTPFRNDQTVVTLAHDQEFPSKDVDSAYEEFANEHRGRSRVALVGSNGGMLHAFQTGECTANCAPTDTKPAEFDLGNGRELWAFIPPDLLPKLQFLVNARRHHLFVDGTPWVRNVWADGANGGVLDHQKEVKEIRTVAIVGERRGGVHWFALDVTDLDDPAYTPDFLWTVPHLDSGKELVMAGESWPDRVPIPPPIGPMLIEDTTATSTVTRSDGVGEIKVTERWIAALPGGYDPLQMRGRGFYIVDAYTGRTYWDFFFDPNDPVKSNLNFSFASVPALTAFGNSSRRQANQYYFDTMLIGDTGGQLWAARFGKYDPAKFVAARVFQQRRDSTSQNDRDPFFQIPWFSDPQQSGALRANLGSGSRHHLRDEGGGECNFDNLAACARAGCTIEIDTDSPKIGPFNLGHADWVLNSDGTWGKQHMESYGIDSVDACERLEHVAKISLKDCPVAGKGGSVTTETYSDEPGLSCDCEDSDCTDAEDDDLECSSAFRDKGNEVVIDCSDQTNWVKNRFYSVRVFGGVLTPSELESDPETFDDNRLTDDDLYDADDTTNSADASSAGWYYEFQENWERTAAPAVTANSCVVFSSLETHEQECLGGLTASDDPCNQGAGQTAWMYFRDYVTGKPGCISPPPTSPTWDDGESRQNMGSDPKPPPPPQVIAQVSAGGETKASIATPEGEGVDVGEGDTLLQSFNVLPVPADLHDIRHAACSGDAKCD